MVQDKDNIDDEYKEKKKNNIASDKEKIKYSERYYYNNKNKKRNLKNENQAFNFDQIIKEFNKLNKTINSFSRSIISLDYKRISYNFNIFVLKIQKYLSNLERTIDLSVSRYSSFLTEDNLCKLKNKIYYQYNLINLYIINYLKDIKNNIEKNIINFINLESNFVHFSNILNKTITNNYNELSSIINSKYKVLNYDDIKRRLEMIWEEKNVSSEIKNITEEWKFSPFSFSINIIDLMKKCGLPESVSKFFNNEKKHSIRYRFLFKIKI